MTETEIQSPMPARKITPIWPLEFDLRPMLLLPAIALVALPLVGSSSTWLTLTVAGLAMGMIIFITASGVTLVFGLMDVLNFGHGLFIAFGAYVAVATLGPLVDWTGSPELWRNLVALGCAMPAAMIAAAALGAAFERIIVRPVYGKHLKQILITMGGGIIGEELIKVIWGPSQIPLPLPEALRGAVSLGDASLSRYRILAVIIGLVICAALVWSLNRTKVGLLVRADVQDREMVEALGYRIGRLFVGVFVTGSALAGLGGVMWGLFQQNLVPQMGVQVNVLIFIVAQNYLQDLLALGNKAAASLPPFAAVLSPDRWLLWLGLLFVLSVYFFPTGIVGTLRGTPERKH